MNICKEEDVTLQLASCLDQQDEPLASANSCGRKQNSVHSRRVDDLKDGFTASRQACRELFFLYSRRLIMLGATGLMYASEAISRKTLLL